VSTPTVPSPAPLRHGFDVSEFSGPNVDFSKLAADGASFAIARSSADVSHHDQHFLSNIGKAKAAGLQPGSYHAFFANHNPQVQACFYASVLKSAGFDDTWLFPMIDFELLRGVDPCTATIRALDFVSRLEIELGLKEDSVFVYTGYYFIGSVVDDILHTNNGDAADALTELAKRPLAIAYYNVSRPLVPKPWTDWKLWQYRGDVQEGGGDVDLDYLRIP
jgi:lysozyme